MLYVSDVILRSKKFFSLCSQKTDSMYSRVGLKSISSKNAADDDATHPFIWEKSCENSVILRSLDNLLAIRLKSNSECLGYTCVTGALSLARSLLSVRDCA